MKSDSILLLVTEDWYFMSHRYSLARFLIEQGFNVSLVTQTTAHENEIKQAGIQLYPIRFPRSFMRPWEDIMALFGIYQSLRQEQPTILQNISLKPVLFGNLVSFVMPSYKPGLTVNVFTGLGFLFTSKKTSANVIRRLITPILRILLRREKQVHIFQNTSDKQTLISLGLAKESQCCLIPGSGVDTKKFIATEELDADLQVVLVARMLYDKGIVDFVKAVELLKSRTANTRFILVGDTDPENPAAIPVSQLEEWQKNGIVEWWGKRDDVHHILQQAHVFVLPSHREGFPKSIIEASAAGRPVVTTDVPGCRDAIIAEQTGLLAKAHHPESLAEQIYRLIMDKQLRVKMGREGRALVEKKFSDERINQKFLNVYNQNLH